MAKVMMNCLPPELTLEEITEIEAAEKMSIVFDEDEMTSEMLEQFHKMDMATIKI